MIIFSPQQDYIRIYISTCICAVFYSFLHPTDS